MAYEILRFIYKLYFLLKPNKKFCYVKILNINKNHNLFLIYLLNESGILTGFIVLDQPLHLNHRCKIFKISYENIPELLSFDGNTRGSWAFEKILEIPDSIGFEKFVGV